MSTLHYRIDGRGPRLLLLHPVGLDLTFFTPLVKALAGRFRILRVDAAGHGSSPATAQPPTLRSYVDDLHQLLADLEWIPTAVAGFSFGGMLAQTLALDYPSDVSALVISACASTFADDSRKAIADRGAVALREGMDAVVAPTMERWFSEAFRNSPESGPIRRRLASNSVEGWLRAWQAIAGVNTHPSLPSIRVPTLCMAGGDDRSAPPPLMQSVASAIPGARLQIVPDAPHMFFIERPRETADAIAAFLARSAQD